MKKLGYPEQSLIYFTKAINLNNYQYYSWKNRAFTNIECLKPEEAIVDLTTIINNVDEDVEFFNIVRDNTINVIKSKKVFPNSTFFQWGWTEF